METPKGQNCAGCRHASETVRNGSGFRECRIHPPAVNLGENKQRALFPLVNDGDWCGMFAPIPQEAAPEPIAARQIENRPAIFEATVIEAQPVAVGVGR